MRRVYQSLLTVSLITVAALSLSGCSNPAGNPEPARSPSNSSSEEVNFPPRGATTPLTPVSESLTKYCPDVEAISLLESPYPASDIQSLNVCSEGNMISFDTNSEWVDAYRAKNTNPKESEDIACVAMLTDPLIVWAVYEDETIPFYAPQDECGFPQPAAKTAYENLTAVVSMSSNTPPPARAL